MKFRTAAADQSQELKQILQTSKNALEYVEILWFSAREMAHSLKRLADLPREDNKLKAMGLVLCQPTLQREHLMGSIGP